jgi:hypothetical protein
MKVLQLCCAGVLPYYRDLQFAISNLQFAFWQAQGPDFTEGRFSNRKSAIENRK